MTLIRKDFRGITDMYLDTAAYNLDPSFNYYLQDPKELEQRRLRAYKYYMDFYDGKQWDDAVGSLTMSEWNPAYGYYYSWNEDFNRRTWNVARNILDKLVSWMVQQEWKVKIPVALQEDDEDAADDYDPYSYGDAGGSTDRGPMDSGSDSKSDGGSSDSGSDDSGSGSSGAPGSGQKNKGNTDSPSSSGAQSGDGKTSSQGGPPGGQDRGQAKGMGGSSGPDVSKTPGAGFGDDAGQSPEDKRKDDENPIQAVLEDVWGVNGKLETTYDIAYQSTITGDAWVKLAYDPDFYADDVGELKLVVLDSRTVIPYWDSHDKRRMIGCRIQYPVKEVQSDGGVKQRMYTEIHTEGTIIEMLDNEPSRVYPNPLGEVMIVHFPNEPLPYRKYGRSDLEALLLPQKEYNEKASDFSEILAYHAAPVTVVKGARVQNLERGARKIWGGIPKDGDVYNLGLDSDLSSAIEYLTMLKKHMHETGNVPEEALGAMQEVSNTSATALHVQYQPLVERTQKKQIHFGKGLRKLNELIIKFYEEAGVLELPDVPPARKYRTEIEWGDPLPRDRTIELTDIATEMGLGIESKKGALIRLGEEAPEKKIQEIREEMMDDAETQYQTAGLLGPAMGMDPSMGGQPGQPGAAPGGQMQNDVSGAMGNNKSPAAKGNSVTNTAVKKSAQTNGNNK